MIKDLIRQTRSYRRFVQSEAVALETLRELVDCARLSASGRNLQPYRYLLSYTPERNAVIFPHLAWAAYIADWPGPQEGERPSAYIIALLDTQLAASVGFDLGIGLQSILLSACEQGIGGCIINRVEKDGLRLALGIPDRYEIICVVGLGKPAETVVLEPLPPSGDVRYWRDDQGVHHVPKRELEELIIDLPS